MRSEVIDAGKVLAFLAELTALTRKYGVEIDGCGCCGSPYLWATDDEGEYKADEGNGHWDTLEYVRPGHEAHIAQPRLFEPIVNPVLLEPGESLSDAMERVVNDTLHDALILPEGYRYEIVSEAQP